MAIALAAVRRTGICRMFSSIPAFTPPQPATKEPDADPNPNLFVSEVASGLSKRTTTEGLRDAFAKFGQVIHAKVVTDARSGYSKGFGFVRYATLEEAMKGKEGMDGKFLDGWVIFADYARPPKPRPPPQENYQPQPQSAFDPSLYYRNQ